MKKNLILLSAILFIHINIIAQVKQAWTNDSILIKAKARKLTEYFEKSTIDKDSVKFQKLFFNEFPNSYNELFVLYGYNEKLGKESILYYQDNYIRDLFNRLTSIPDKEYFSKLIKISIGGKWNADGISAFQQGVREHCTKKPEFAYSLLSNLSEKDQKSFWIFYFDGPHPENKSSKAFDKLKSKYPKVWEYMSSSFKQVKDDWKNE